MDVLLVTINCATEGATIRYTTNGNDPSEESDVYSNPILISTTTTIKAKGFKDGCDDSEIAQDIYTIEEVRPAMILVEGGTFNPTNDYTVTLSSFYISNLEVTQSEWASVMGGIYDPDWSDRGHGPNHPAYRISWYDAIEYCNRLSIREGLTLAYSYGDSGTNPEDWPDGWNTNIDNHTNVSCNWNADGYRLPTEMEREFAARGGLPAQQADTFNDLWAGTNVEGQLVNYAWYSSNSGGRTHPVGTKLPNELGLYDMSGNVWNWVWDIGGGYPTGVHNNPTGPTTGDWRVCRGGSWNSGAFNCRVDYRYLDLAYFRHSTDGFRVSRTLN